MGKGFLECTLSPSPCKSTGQTADTHVRDKKCTWPLSPGLRASAKPPPCRNSSHKASSRGFFLRLQQRCRDTQASFLPRQLRPQGAQTQRHEETQVKELGLAPRHSAVSLHRYGGHLPPPRAGVWLLQLKSSTTIVLPFRADPSSLPRLVEGESRELQPHPTPRVWEERGGGLPWSYPAHGKTLSARNWLLFQSNSLE